MEKVKERLILILLFIVLLVGVVVIAFFWGKRPKEEINEVAPEEAVMEVASEIEFDIFVFDNIEVNILEYNDTPEINVRSMPSRNDNIVGTVHANDKFYVTEYYVTKDKNWYGFPVDQVKGCHDNDDDGMVWINEYYVRVDTWKYAENFENYQGEVSTWYDNGSYTIKIAEDTNLRCCPGYDNDGAIYGLLKQGYEIDTNIVYKNGNNRFCGFPVEDLKCGLYGHTFGNPDNDKDGIVWVAIENVKVYAD